MAELSARAQGNPAAVEGLKRAAVENVLDKFVPEGGEGKPDRLQSYLAAKRDILSKIMSPSEIDALGSKATAASAAGQAVKEVAPGLVASAFAPDGIIEGLESSNGHYLVAVQWHPEELADKMAPMRQLFASFLTAAAEPLAVPRG